MPSTRRAPSLRVRLALCGAEARWHSGGLLRDFDEFAALVAGVGFNAENGGGRG